MSLKAKSEALHEAAQQMAAEIRKNYPIGCTVEVNMGGNRYMRGIVACEPNTHPACCSDVHVQSRTGHVHAKHFSDVCRLV